MWTGRNRAPRVRTVCLLFSTCACVCVSALGYRVIILLFVFYYLRTYACVPLAPGDYTLRSNAGRNKVPSKAVPAVTGRDVVPQGVRSGAGAGKV